MPSRRPEKHEKGQQRAPPIASRGIRLYPFPFVSPASVFSHTTVVEGFDRKVGNGARRQTRRWKDGYQNGKHGERCVYGGTAKIVSVPTIAINPLCSKWV